MKNMDKGLTVPKWVLINCLKIPELPQNLFAQIVSPCPKVWDFDEKKNSLGVRSTVGINPRLSDLRGARTSKLVWRYFEANRIDGNQLQIRTISQVDTGTKIEQF